MIKIIRKKNNGFDKMKCFAFNSVNQIQNKVNNKLTTDASVDETKQYALLSFVSDTVCEYDRLLPIHLKKFPIILGTFTGSMKNLCFGTM